MGFSSVLLEKLAPVAATKIWALWRRSELTGAEKVMELAELVSKKFTSDFDRDKVARQLAAMGQLVAETLEPIFSNAPADNA